MGVPADSERAYWVLLSWVAGIGPVRFRRLLELCGDARSAWHASDHELATAGVDRRSIASLQQLRSTLTPNAALARLQQLGIRAVCLDDPEYPPLLLQIVDPPQVLFVRGRFSPADDVAVAIVGTRKATSYGRTVAERFASDLAVAGVTVVSGLAKGVDTAAHRAAVEAGGRTIAVLGHGLDRVYPPENTALARKIVEQDAGALVSEFAPGVPPDAANFPRRNRLISGLSRASVIVEAGFRSGALITADFALEQGRDVYAVPGSVLSPASAGVNDLIKQGAPLVTSAADVLEALDLAVPSNGAVARAVPALEGREAAVYAALEAEPLHVDDLARSLGGAVGEISATLALLELKGLAQQVGSMAYVRSEPRPESAGARGRPFGGQ